MRLTLVVTTILSYFCFAGLAKAENTEEYLWSFINDVEKGISETHVEEYFLLPVLHERAERIALDKLGKTKFQAVNSDLKSGIRQRLKQTLSRLIETPISGLSWAPSAMHEIWRTDPNIDEVYKKLGLRLGDQERLYCELHQYILARNNQDTIHAKIGILKEKKSILEAKNQRLKASLEPAEFESVMRLLKQPHEISRSIGRAIDREISEAQRLKATDVAISNLEEFQASNARAMQAAQDCSMDFAYILEAKKIKASAWILVTGDNRKLVYIKPRGEKLFATAVSSAIESHENGVRIDEALALD